MRIALIGAGGQLGTDLQMCLEGDVAALGHDSIEITDAANVEAVLSKVAPECVVNAAAYNLVDRAEDEPDVAYAVNALGPRNLAMFCGARDIPLLHVSTDFVFSGRIRLFGLEIERQMPYREFDTPQPLSAYAVSKLAGEHYVARLCRRHFVVRTCGLYGCGGTRGKGNFVETMFRLATERDELKVVDDQICTPTASADLAHAIQAVINTDAYGLYHATNLGSTSWYNFAREIFRLAKSDTQVSPVTSAQFGAKAARPSYSVLNQKKLSNALGFELQTWQQALAQYLSERSV